MGNSKLNISRLGGGKANFQNMIQRFGVVTVMNARIYEPLPLTGGTQAEPSYDGLLAPQIIGKFCTGVDTNGNLVFKAPLARLDTLKVANANQEGPSKTVTGGQYSNPLIKYGKTMTLEMQDALGNARALDALCGTVSEAGSWLDSSESTEDSDDEGTVNYDDVWALHVTADFAGPKLIIGDTFFIDQESGQQVKALIAFYQFLPDSIFNLTQDAEGDATVFDMNGSLLATDILIHNIKGTKVVHGAFYSIVDPEDVKNVIGQ